MRLRISPETLHDAIVVILIAAEKTALTLRLGTLF
jgi:hypothetical protein